PYRILDWLVNTYSGIETNKLLLALEAKNDSEEEYSRISNLVERSFDEIVAVFTQLVDNSSFVMNDNMDVIDLLHKACVKQKNEKFLMNFIKDSYASSNNSFNAKNQQIFFETIKKLQSRYKIPVHILEEIYVELAPKKQVLGLYWELTKLYMNKKDKRSQILTIFYYINAKISESSYKPKDLKNLEELPLYSEEEHMLCYYVTIASLIAYSKERRGDNAGTRMKNFIHKILKHDPIKAYHKQGKENFFYNQWSGYYEFQKETAKLFFKLLINKNLYETVYVFRVLLEANMMPHKSYELFAEVLKQQYLQSQLDYLEIGRCIGIHNNILKTNKVGDYEKMVDIALKIQDISVDDKFKEYINHLLMQFVVSNNIDNFERAKKLYAKYKSIVTICDNFKEKSFDNILQKKAKIYVASKNFLVQKLCKDAATKFNLLAKQYGNEAQSSINLKEEQKDSDLSKNFNDYGLLKEVNAFNKKIEQIISQKKWKKALMPIVAEQQDKIWQKEKLFNKEDNKDALCFLTHLEKEQDSPVNDC
ncbi:MAG: hypothetical protein COB50_04710, partial [Thiotrichales bacterium]